MDNELKDSRDRRLYLLDMSEIDKTVIVYRIRHSKEKGLRRKWLQRHDNGELSCYTSEAWQARLEVLLEEDFKDLNHDR